MSASISGYLAGSQPHLVFTPATVLLWMDIPTERPTPIHASLVVIWMIFPDLQLMAEKQANNLTKLFRGYEIAAMAMKIDVLFSIQIGTFIWLVVWNMFYFSIYWE